MEPQSPASTNASKLLQCLGCGMLTPALIREQAASDKPRYPRDFASAQTHRDAAALQCTAIAIRRIASAPGAATEGRGANARRSSPRAAVSSAFRAARPRSCNARSANGVEAISRG